ncbi:S8 family serine peptidase [Aquabacterium sp. J223]|uniref:S8 family serine peptidase n=1 Tax=Aquabacterium sp. J223 TaxID=2898431 RepID=UPI0021AD91E9|nr:S8 family serine peptidase [Aquabacterium sp. J223]
MARRSASPRPAGGDGSGILSTLNSGSTTPLADSYALYQGTSMAAPHVTGAVSLLLSVQPTLSPAEVLQRLQASARRFPSGTGSDCGSGQCGAGLLDAGALLAAAVAAPAPATTWTLLVREGQAFSASGTVRYGTGNHWVVRSVNGAAQCTNDWFGNDPAYGTTKQCELASGSSGSPAASWTRIASEYGSFDLGTTPHTVRYGVNGAWTQLTVAGAGQCSNAFFGNDPAYGWAKVCEAMPLATAANWTTVAQEWQGFNVSGTRSVRYGIDGRWVVRNVAGHAACTNEGFGTDPAPGVVKRCEVLG